MVPLLRFLSVLTPYPMRPRLRCGHAVLKRQHVRHGIGLGDERRRLHAGVTLDPAACEPAAWPHTHMAGKHFSSDPPLLNVVLLFFCCAYINMILITHVQCTDCTFQG